MKALQPVSPLEISGGNPSTPAAFSSLHNSHKIYLKHALHVCAECMDTGCLALASVATAGMLLLITVARVILYAEPCCWLSQMNS